MAKVEKKLNVCGLDYTLYELTNSETGEKHIDVFKTGSYQLCTLNLSFDNTDKEIGNAIRKHYLMKNSKALSEAISLYKEALYDLIPEGKDFYELTDEEVIELCKKDSDGLLHDIFDDFYEIAERWAAETIFYPDFSYMRVIRTNPFK